MKPKLFPVLVLSVLFAACGKEAHVHTPGDGHGKEAGHTDDHGGGGHGSMASLGSIQLGGVAVEVKQEGTVEAGKEAGVDLSFAKGAAVPDTVRAWVGVESAAGSLKAKLDKEGDDGMVMVMVPGGIVVADPGWYRHEAWVCHRRPTSGAACCGARIRRKHAATIAWG